MILPVRLYGDPILRKKARSISSFDINLKQLASDMIETMYHHNGVGLAGPQIGLNKRIFVALELDKESEVEEQDLPDPETIAEKRARWRVINEHIIINPHLSKLTGQAFDIEGCLSIPRLYAKEILRNEHLALSYQNISGKEQALKAKGHFARVIQHEFDHLEGKLFIDLLEPQNKQGFMNEHRKDLADMQREAKAFLKDLNYQVQPVAIT